MPQTAAPSGSIIPSVEATAAEVALAPLKKNEKANVAVTKPSPRATNAPLKLKTQSKEKKKRVGRFISATNNMTNIMTTSAEAFSIAFFENMISQA